MNLIIEKTILTTLSMILCVSIAVPVLFIGISVTNQSSSPLQAEALASTLEDNVVYLIGHPDEVITQTVFYPEICTITSGSNTIQISWTSTTGPQFRSINAPIEIVVVGAHNHGWNDITGYIKNNILYFEFTSLAI